MRREPRVAIAVTALFVLLTGCSAGTPTGPTPARGAPRPTHRISVRRILAFGDSLTAGTTSPVVNRGMSAGLSQSYPARLQRLLTRWYPDQAITVENGGNPGEHASVAVRRLVAMLPVVNPDVVILLHGANDIAGGGGVGAGLLALAALQTMVRDANLSGARVILCTLLPQRPGTPRTANPVVVAGFNERIRDLARIEDIALADLAQELDVSLIGVDGLHPTEERYVRMADMIFAVFRELFERPPLLH